jgi:glycine cleavage system H protein
MGLYKAKIPSGLLYSPIHFWLEPVENRTRCGLTSYAMRLLGDVFRLEWKIQVGEPLAPAQLLGEIESTKAASELYAPLSGKVLALNDVVVGDPSSMSVDPYGAWLLEIDGWPQNALRPAEYVAFLASGWEKTMQMFKQ